MGLEHEIKTMDAASMGLHVVTREELDGIHDALMGILDEIDRVCKANGIQWGISGGSALGAIRHRGFIPWDDDVDIVMTRRDFDRFKEVFPRDAAPYYTFLCPGEENYYSHLPRVYNSHTTMEVIQNTGRGKGLYVDIFVLDNVSDNPILFGIHGVLCTMYLFIVSCVVTRTQRDLLYRYGTDALKRKVRLRSFFGALFGLRKPESWIRSEIRCISRVKDEGTKRVVSATGSGHFFNEIYKRDKITRFREMPFEDRQYPVIAELDAFCRMRFGDNYMEIPPLERQEKHAYISLDLTK